MTTTENQTIRSLLLDAFARIEEQVASAVADLDPEDARWRPDRDANPVGWLLWHLTRVMDDHVAELAGVEQAWTAQGFAEVFALPFPRETVGYGQSSDEVAAFRADPAEILRYHRATQELARGHLSGLTAAGLARVVDENWDPPVTEAVRIMSVLGDATAHIGQAQYVLGLLERRAG
ncbi:MAG: DinB family protein [Nakamurella sp.]